MALSATMRRFTIALSDVDRGVYEELEWRVAQHPSESERYLVARILARALEHGEGLEFSKGGVSDDEEPALVQRDLRGDLLAWIEIGSPTPDRLHKAAKVTKRVVVYTWKSPEQLAEAIAERKVHRAEHIELRGLDPDWLDRVASTLDRNNTWDLSVTGGAIYLTIGSELFETTVSVSGSASRSD
ncbi:MAG TPA: YaeQ family protein [Kofleriaceae bacterium]|nr:YaeQ family protein [Kofleriaceae bacterium]